MWMKEGRRQHPREFIEPLAAEEGRQDRQHPGAVGEFALGRHLVQQEVGQPFGKLGVGLAEGRQFGSEQAAVVFFCSFGHLHIKTSPFRFQDLLYIASQPALAPIDAFQQNFFDRLRLFSRLETASIPFSLLLYPQRA